MTTWHEIRLNLAAVARHMAERGDTAEDVAYMLEKPHKYNDEWAGVQTDATFDAIARDFKENR